MAPHSYGFFIMADISDFLYFGRDSLSALSLALVQVLQGFQARDRSG